MKSPRFTPAEAAQIERDLKGPAQAQEDHLLAMGWQTELDLLNRMMAWAFHAHRDPRSPA